MPMRSWTLAVMLAAIASPAAALEPLSKRQPMRELPSDWLDDELGPEAGDHPAESAKSGAGCRRSEATTGLIVGAVAGGLLGNAIDGGRSRAVGTILGAGGGALLGREVERRADKCR